MKHPVSRPVAKSALLTLVGLIEGIPGQGCLSSFPPYQPAFHQAPAKILTPLSGFRNELLFKLISLHSNQTDCL